MSEICCRPACADAVGSLLVLLHLLKCQAERFAKFFLTHAQHNAAHSHTAADILVDRIGGLGLSSQLRAIGSQSTIIVLKCDGVPAYAA